MKIGVAGPIGYASFRIRGFPLTAHNEWDVLDVAKPIRERYDAIWLVKRKGRNFLHVRDWCDKLLADPLDFWHWPNKVDPISCWTELYSTLGFDSIISTSPACRDVMRQGLHGCNVPVHMLPHQCDELVKPDWYDPNGPIVYAGQRAYIEDYAEIIDDACGLIGRQFRPNYSENHGHRGLRGAALVLAIRSHKLHAGSSFTRHCKAQIKIENAAAMRCPVLCGGHEAETSLHPECVVAQHADFLAGPQRIARLLSDALAASPPSTCYRLSHFAADARRVVELTLAGDNTEIENYGDRMDCQAVAAS